MNVVCFKGGIGNQMFQYALYMSIALNNKVKGTLKSYESEKSDGRNFDLLNIFENVKIDIDEKSYHRKIERLHNPNAFDRFIYKKRYLRHKFAYHQKLYYAEGEESVYDDNVFKYKNAIIEGYWQTEKYFKSVEQKIRDAYIFNIALLNSNQLNLAQRITDTENTVAVHFRRGDYLKFPDLFVDVSSSSYYDIAVDRIMSIIENPVFVFFSDDIAWVKKKYSNFENAIFVDDTTLGVDGNTIIWLDMYLMSLCKHLIIANSTYSWWAAWLCTNSNKTVIAPEKWLTNKKTPDIWCNGWIKCPVENTIN